MIRMRVKCRDGVSFVRLLAKFMPVEDRVKVTSFGIESARNNNVDVA